MLLGPDFVMGPSLPLIPEVCSATQNIWAIKPKTEERGHQHSTNCLKIKKACVISQLTCVFGPCTFGPFVRRRHYTNCHSRKVDFSLFALELLLQKKGKSSSTICFGSQIEKQKLEFTIRFGTFAPKTKGRTVGVELSFWNMNGRAKSTSHHPFWNHCSKLLWAQAPYRRKWKIGHVWSNSHLCSWWLLWEGGRIHQHCNK